MNYRDGGDCDDPRAAPPGSVWGKEGPDRYEDAPVNQGLLSGKRKTVHPHYRHGGTVDPGEWKRPYWLGAGLFLILFAFWLLDSLKDPVFVRLVDGKISEHQPPAKLCSVLVTLCLVCLLEFWTNHRQQRQRAALREAEAEVTGDEAVLDPGGVWKRIRIASSSGGERERGTPEQAPDDTVSFDIFYCIGVPYLLAFSVLAYFVWTFEQHEHEEREVMLAAAAEPIATTATAGGGGGTIRKLSTAMPTESDNNNDASGENPTACYVLGYVLYATVESFGSLAVAAFWSYTNSTLSLRDAERYYGPVIATAQLGAVAGSTLVATGRWESSSLLVVVALSIVLQLLLMRGYDRRFEPTAELAADPQRPAFGSSGGRKNRHYGSGCGDEDEDEDDDDAMSVVTLQDGNATLTKPFWSGLYLVFSHSYVLLILGVSCLYEVAMTLLDYQMKLLGFARFRADGGGAANRLLRGTMSFSKFMGHYGQVVNLTSLLFSSLLFPFLIKRLGLRRTLLWFPTMLLVVTFLAYGAMPGNLAVLFVSLSLLKAMTYSIHDPSKELLYIPTSNAVKFRAKFWIDVVGERISKAIGSAFNTLARDVEESLRIGTLPCLLTALGLWTACYLVGLRFDELLATGKIVGLEHPIDPSTYSRVPGERDGGDDCESAGGADAFYGGRGYDCRPRGGFGELEISFVDGDDEDAVSTLDLLSDPAAPRGGEPLAVRGIEMPSLSRRV